MKRTALKRKTRLKPITPKTADRNKVWRDVCLWRASYLTAKYGRIICEFCGKTGSSDKDSVWGIWGHHIDGDRDNTDLSNCYMCHTATCHDKITRENLQVTQEGFEGGKDGS